jgi:hypothetical protein
MPPGSTLRESLKVASCPFRVMVTDVHIISVIHLFNSQEQLCEDVGMVKVWLECDQHL